MPAKTKILVLSFSELKRDPRIHRQLLFLEGKGEITTVGFSPPKLPVPHHISVPPLKKTLFDALFLLCRAFETVYWNTPTVKTALEALQNESFDLIVASDLSSLPLAIRLKKKFLLYDAHEYAPEEFNHRLIWRIFCKKYADYLCREYLSYPDAMMTVSPHIANLYAERYQVQPEVVTNATHYYTLPPQPVNPDHIKLLYHGGVDPSRKIDSLLETISFLDSRFTLDIIAIPGDRSYIEKMKAKATKRVRFLPPVPMEEIPKFCNQYDIGFFPCFPDEVNYDHCLPNKFFEFIQGRNAIATFPSEAMGKIIREYDLGVVASKKNPKEMAQILNSLSAEDIERFKKNTEKAAQIHCSENNKERFLRLCAFS